MLAGLTLRMVRVIKCSYKCDGPAKLFQTDCGVGSVCLPRHEGLAGPPAVTASVRAVCMRLRTSACA